MAKLEKQFDNVIMRSILVRDELEETKEQCVEIADEFAIGFAEWLDINFKLNFTNNVFKDLLVIYKEEKGL